MVFTNVVNPRSHVSRKHEYKPTVVKKGATIGAGAVVTRDVPDYAMILGNPGRSAGWMCECGHQVQFRNGVTACGDCGKQYRQTSKGVERFQPGYISCDPMHEEFQGAF